MNDARLFSFQDDGSIPNNPSLPVLFYPGAFSAQPEKIEQFFQQHGWGNTWQGGVFGYHHYHSNTHEALGVVSGSARLQLGGEEGDIVSVKSGDVCVLPAGTGHFQCCIEIPFYFQYFRSVHFCLCQFAERDTAFRNDNNCPHARSCAICSSRS